MFQVRSGVAKDAQAKPEEKKVGPAEPQERVLCLGKCGFYVLSATMSYIFRPRFFSLDVTVRQCSMENLENLY